MIDWPLVGEILIWVFTAFAVLLALVALAVRFKFNGILHWNTSLEDEYKALVAEQAASHDTRRIKAIQVVLNRYGSIRKSHSPDLKDITGVVGFIREIATCYHPDSKNPEFRITAGRLLNCAKEVGTHLDGILSQQGFRRIRDVRIRHILEAKDSYEGFIDSKPARALSRILKPLGKVLSMRFFFFPDPVSILAFLSNRLAVLTATRSLLLDAYLFAGKLAVRAYDPEEMGLLELGSNELEQGLQDLEESGEGSFDVDDPTLKELREKLPGWKNLLDANPSFSELKEVLVVVAQTISQKHFPDAGKPLLEAKIGPTLERSQHWLQILCDTGKLPLARNLLNVRIEGFLGTKQALEAWMPKPVRAFMQEAMKLYGKMKWPLKVFRWAKKFSPQKVALDVGVHLAYKATTGLLCRRVFDSICVELDKVYRESK